jgi:hypothetical protein
MFLRCGVVWCVAAVLLFGSAVLAPGQGYPAPMGFSGVAGRPVPFQRPVGFYADLVVSKFINSFATYQFPDPDTGIDPLSRLEFPIDQWFIGFKATSALQGVSLNLEVLRNLNEKSSLKTQDSDWEFPANPDQKTTFSESDSRLPEAWLVDVSTDWAMFCPYIRPVLGLRWQTFHFIGGDGFQNSFPRPAPTPLTGDTFDVRFTFKHLYVGGIADFGPAPFGMRLQADYAWVTAENADRHLLRGDRLTKEKASGWCVHLAASVRVSLTDSLSFLLQGDFKRIRTRKGSHDWWDDSGAFQESWDGAEMWSDQQSLSAYCELRF